MRRLPGDSPGVFLCFAVWVTWGGCSGLWQQNILISGEKPGQTFSVKENVPKTATKRGETIAAEEKCPRNHHKTRRNHLRRRRMPRKPPQNRGKDVRFRRLSGTFVNVKTD